jgi:hypothetical protein
MTEEVWINPSDYTKTGRLQIPKSNPRGNPCCRKSDPDVPLVPSLIAPTTAEAKQEWFAKSSREIKRAIAIVNPHGGGKTALNVFEEIAAPVLKDLNIHYEVKLTQKANHGYLLAKEFSDTDHCDVIVPVGGDG